MVIQDSEYSKIELENGILIATWKTSFIDITIAKEAVKNRLKVTNKENYPTLIKIKSIKDSTKEARDFLASAQGCEGLTAAAIYVESMLQTMIATLFIYLNKPLIPTKIFKNENKAKEWLAGFVKDKNNR